MSWHTQQSTHNHDVWQYLSGCVLHADWEITTLFYSAMHAVEERLFEIGKNPRSHHKRNEYVRKYIRHVWREYHALYCLCRRARYEVLHGDISEEERQTAVQLHRAICQKLKIGDYSADR